MQKLVSNTLKQMVKTMNNIEWKDGKRGRRNLIYGVGLNDATYKTQYKVDGKVVRCPYYVTWSAMLRRCYSEKFKLSKPTYNDCCVCEDWKVFSVFKSWMIKQDWQGNQLDKDILRKGNKVYSPEFCVFVPALINSFFIANDANRGELPIGVSWCDYHMKYKSSCSNPFTKKGDSLGFFDSPHEAHKAWMKRKHEHAVRLAETVNDERVASALINRFRGDCYEF